MTVDLDHHGDDDLDPAAGSGQLDLAAEAFTLLARWLRIAVAAPEHHDRILDGFSRSLRGGAGQALTER